MAGHDHEGRNAAQAIDPVGVAGRHGARCQVPDARCQMPDASERR
jgi:hypothetical protein